MDYSKIKLNNERNEHVTKRLNRLNTWNFFKVLYRENVMRLFGFSLLMILCVAPIVALIVWGNYNNTMFGMTLPQLNGFGFSTGVWNGMNEYFAEVTARNNLFTGLYCVAASLLCALVFSGGFAIVRDAFWTGKLSAVGVFRSFGKGVKASVLYGLAADVILAFSVFGAYQFYVYASVAWPLWVAIVVLVLICIAIMFVAIYLMILCSVATVYKQSVADNLDDAWRLMWLNILPNIIHFLLALIPVALYFAFANSALFTILLVLLLMFGGMYVPLVWQTHMMKTFALFHPVEVKKKKKNQLHLKAELPASDNSDKQEPKSDIGEDFDDEDVYATEEEDSDNDDEPGVSEEGGEAQADVPIVSADDGEPQIVSDVTSEADIGAEQPQTEAKAPEKKTKAKKKK